MPDISMCQGKDCPQAEDCYRHKAEPGRWQSWFARHNVMNEDRTCDYFMVLYKKEQGDEQTNNKARSKIKGSSSR
jgi:hypothetical protein